MTSRQALDSAILIAATALTRFVFRSHYLYDIDSVNFALALKRFDPSVHQPHPPGYFLYVCLGRLANLLFHDANAALVAISIVFSCGAVAMIYVLADRWFGRNAACIRRSGLSLLSPGVVSRYGGAHLHRRSLLLGSHRISLLADLLWSGPVHFAGRDGGGHGGRFPSILAPAAGPSLALFVS